MSNCKFRSERNEKRTSLKTIFVYNFVFFYIQVFLNNKYMNWKLLVPVNIILNISVYVQVSRFLEENFLSKIFLMFNIPIFSERYGQS